MGGQVKIDINMLQEMMMRVEGGSPTDHVVSILKPAALAFLEIESTVPKHDKKSTNAALDFAINRSSVDYDFYLSQKSYALTINALSAIAMNRPSFFYDAAVALAQRAVNPPTGTEGGDLSRAATLVISSQLRASCLTLLRNASSITTNASVVLHDALVIVDMELQADKAMHMASQANQLKTASRSARNQAKMFYEWDASEVDRRSTKRQKETDDALAKMRAAKRQRGLGGGIQLPTSMSDAVELILLNLEHLQKRQPSTTTASVETQVSLDYVVDAVMTNGASLLRDEGRWYDRNGGTAWILDFSSTDSYKLGPSLFDTVETVNSSNVENETTDENTSKRSELFLEQSRTVAMDTVRRILSSTTNSRSKSLAKLGNRLAARMSFLFRKSEPSGPYKESYSLAKDSATAVAKLLPTEEAKSLQEFVKEFPLVASSIALVATSKSACKGNSMAPCNHCVSILNEAFMQSDCINDVSPSDVILPQYEMSLNLFVASVVHASQLAKDKPNDEMRMDAATQAASRLQKVLLCLPALTPSALVILSAMCDIDDIAKKSNEASQKATTESTAETSTRAAKAAAEVRASAALLLIRNVAFQSDVLEIRKCAVDCMIGISSGRLPSSLSIHEKALTITMKALFSKNDMMANLVVSAVLSDLQEAATWAVSKYDEIQKGNNESQRKDKNMRSNPLAILSDVEKMAVEKMKKMAVLVMALGMRRIELVKKLFELSCQEKSCALFKAVGLNMPKLATATATKYGVSKAALLFADMSSSSETAMLLIFLESLVATLDKALPNQEIIEACFKIQELRSQEDGKHDPRYLIPVVAGMKRDDLVNRLPEFVSAENDTFKLAVTKMCDRLGRHALHFRDEPDVDKPTLNGMTLCEQFVYLHRLDFNAAGIPQKRYLAAIDLCLEDDNTFSDQVLMSALDVMSGQFLAGVHKLPLGFMRTNIIVCSKHESLHSWMCNVLLPRLVEGMIWSDPRQWEGWMRLAHILEQSDDPTVSSTIAINALPAEQLLQYQTKWAKS
jgi:symplekin